MIHESLLLLFIASLGCYLIGAIPFSFLIPRIFFEVDIRKHGSGNPGASNVSRVCGKKFGFLALFLDVGKGVVAVFILSQLGFPLVLGFLSIIGHIANPLFYFSGGKGVATSLGVISYLSWPTGLAFMLIWVVVFLIWNIAGLSSLASISFTPVSLYLLEAPLPVLWASVLLVLIIYFTHRGNISRLIKGKERGI